MFGMKNDNKYILYDFDGTIINKDSLWLFLKESCNGSILTFSLKLLQCIPSCLHCIFSGKGKSSIKEQLLVIFFKDITPDKFRKICLDFVSVIDNNINTSIASTFSIYKKEKAKFVIISASLYDWIKPWADKNSFEYVIATEPLFNQSGRFTGFSTNNCKGNEKVNRIKEILDLNNSYLIGFGNSKDDYPFLSICDESYIVNKNGHISQYQ